MRMAIIVMTYNRSDALLAVLRGLAPQCGPQETVVVADDGSKDAHVQALRAGLPRFACPVRHVWHPDVGFTLARSRNLGALAARADYLVFIDGDCVPNARFVAHHRALAQPGCFVNGSRVLLSRELSARVIAGTDPQQLRKRDWLALRAKGDANKLAHLMPWLGAPGRMEQRFKWKGIRGCNLGIWWDDYQAINGCDESFSGWGHEDADLVLRLHRLGRTRKNGWLATEVYHLWHPENSRANEQANRARVESRMQGGSPRAQVGLAEAGNQSGVVVTELN